MNIKNSKKFAIRKGKWTKPNASFYDTLMKEDNYKALINEAFLLHGKVFKETPYSSSKCKYPHHSIVNGELVLNEPGVRAAYARAKQMGVYYGRLKSHLDKHLKELGIFNEEKKIQENFEFIESALGINEDDYFNEVFNESAEYISYKNNFKSKNPDFNYQAIDINDKRAYDYIANDPYVSKYLDYLKDNTGEIYIDINNNKLIGYVFIGKTKDKGFISTLEVKEDYRGYGFGNKLLNDAIEQYGAIDLVVDKDNKVAIDLYKKAGFEIIKEMDNDQYWMKLKRNSKDGDIEDKWYIRSDDGVDNCCLKIKGYDKPMRGRSSMICLRKDDNEWKVLYKENQDGDYGVPGGGWNKDEDPKNAAIRELQEESLSNVKDVEQMGILIEYHDYVADWVKEHVDEKDWWYGYYSVIFVGVYDGEFKGEVDERDRECGYDWISINETRDKFPKEYIDAIDAYLKKNDTINECMNWIDNFVHDEVFREKAYFEEGAITSPYQLLDWMKDQNFKYGWITRGGKVHDGSQNIPNDFYNNFHLQSPTQLISSKVGVCWDFVELERLWFRQNEYKFAIFYIILNDAKVQPTHTFLVFSIGMNHYWFEYSWEKYRGIHRYGFVDVLIKDVIMRHRQEYNDYSSPVSIHWLQATPKYGITCQQYMKYANKEPKLDFDQLPSKLFRESSEPVNIDPMEGTNDMGNIIFDLGSVLVKNTLDYTKFPKGLSKESIDYLVHTYFDNAHGVAETMSYDQLLKYYTSKIERSELKQYAEEVFYLCTSSKEPFDYTNDLLTELLKKGYRLYYLSNWNKASYEILAKKGVFDFLKYFKGGIFSWQVDMIKPNKEIYEALLKKYSLLPGRCVFYDDKEENVIAATECGINAVRFTKESIQELHNLPDLVEIHKHFDEAVDNNVELLPIYGVATAASLSKERNNGEPKSKDELDSIGTRKMLKAISRGDHYNHILLSFNDDLTEMYSFNNHGIVKESINDPTRWESTEAITISVMFFPRKDWERMHNTCIDWIKNHKAETTYAYSDLIKLFYGKPIKNEKRFLCSSFAGYILSLSDRKNLSKDYSRLRPEDVTILPRSFFVMTVRDRTDFKEKKEEFKNKVNSILNEHKEEILEYNNDIPKLMLKSSMGKLKTFDKIIASIFSRFSHAPDTVEESFDPFKLDLGDIFTEADEDNPPNIDNIDGGDIEEAPPELEEENNEEEKPEKNNTEEEPNNDQPPEIEDPSKEEEEDTMNAEQEEPKEEDQKEEPQSLPKQTDAAEKDKNGVNRKKLYIAFIEWCKDYNNKNTFGSVFDKDAFNVTYPFVPHEMRYFYRLANPMLCVLAGDLTFFPLADLKKINSQNPKMNELLIFAATPDNNLRVFNNKDKKVYKASEENGNIKIEDELGSTFDLYLQGMINQGDYLNAPSNDEKEETVNGND